MPGIDFEPAILCLTGSLLWAPLVYLAATRLDRGRSLTASEMLWLTALGVAALPTLVAPALAAAGISLRPIPEEIPTAVLLEAARNLEPLAIDTAAPVIEGPQITFDTLINAASLLYIYGVLLAFGVWATRSIFFALHVRRAKAIDHPQLIHALEIWRRRLDVEPKLDVRISGAVSSVCVYGVFNPVIVVPADLNARISFEDLVMMCAHELAHVRRGDCRLFAASAAARVLFWFNPFVKRISARAELAAEQSADALVLNCGADRRAYAACFVEGLRYAAERAQISRVAVPSFTPFDKKSRRDRLDAILSGEERPRRRPSTLAIAVAAALAGALAVAQAAIAVQPSDEDAAEPVIAELPVDGSVSLAFAAPFDQAVSKKRQSHEGVDIAAPRGSDVRSPAVGVVVDATDVYQGEPSWGKVVVIKHRDGLTTRYAHLDSYAVKKGDRIEAGEKIGEVGSSGKATGSHLHFEAIVDGENVDPLPLLGLGAPAAPAAPAVVMVPANVSDAVPVIVAKPANMRNAHPAPVISAAPAAPAEAISPADALDPVESVDLELAGAPQAPRARVVRREFKGFGTMAPEAFMGFSNGDKGSILFKDGEGFAWKLADGSDFDFGKQGWSEKDQKALQESLKDMHAKMAKAKEQHAAAMEQLGLAMKDMDFDDGDFSALTIEANERAREAMKSVDKEKIKKAVKQAQKTQWAWSTSDAAQAERDRQQALRDQEQRRRDQEQVQRDQEQARREQEQAERQAEREAAWAERQTELEQARAEREAERAEMLAEQEAERVQVEAERAQEQAEQEAERAQAEAERITEQAEYEMERAHEQQANDRRQMLDLREQALAEAERALEEERAEIDRLRDEIESDDSGSDDDGQ